MKLSEFASLVEKLERGGWAWEPIVDEHEGTEERRPGTAEWSAERCEQAYAVQSEIVKILWSPHARGEAEALAERLRAIIRAERRGPWRMLGPEIAPRFEGRYNYQVGRAEPPIY